MRLSSCVLQRACLHNVSSSECLFLWFDRPVACLCVQFLSNPAVTFGTAIAAFYLPVIIMTVLYIHISLASRSRVSKHKPEKKEKKGIK